MAAQIAAAEAHEDGRRTAVVAFALEGVEYFVDMIHRLRDFGTSRLRALLQAQGPASQSRSLAVSRQLFKILRGVILDVGGLVVARLPHISAVAVRYSVDNPFGYILGRRIEVEDIIDVGMVDLAMNQTLDFGKIAHHAIAVELFTTAIHVDLPVVAMQVLAFALIVEIKLVTGGYF